MAPSLLCSATAFAASFFAAISLRRFCSIIRSKKAQKFLPNPSKSPDGFRPVCDIFHLQYLGLLMGEEHFILFPAIGVIQERGAEIRAVIMIRQRDKISKLAEEPDDRIYTMSVSARGNRD